VPRSLLYTLGTLAALIAGVGWITLPAVFGAAPASSDRAEHVAGVRLSGPEADRRRIEMLRRATFQTEIVTPPWPRLDTCWFVEEAPSGTTPKFDCLFENGTALKVKYGRGPEPHAEVAATRLLGALGYAADHVTFVPRLRCFGCPRYPFMAMHLATPLRLLGLGAPTIGEDGFTDFMWVSVERRFEAPSIETDTVEGWAWWELARWNAPGAELDAFKLLAVFLAHWDNKSSNQRLVCLDGHDPHCPHPVAMMQDLGATFGPTKVALARWRDLPIWADRRRCLVSMKTLPHDGATFEDARISEEGRATLARQLSALSEDDIRDIFRAARFPEYQSGPDDGRDLDAWTGAFKDRVAQIANATCPDPDD
jgi:hypothetical protein